MIVQVMKEVLRDPFLDELEKDLLKFLPQLSLESELHQNHVDNQLHSGSINDLGNFNAAMNMEQSFSSTNVEAETSPPSLPLNRDGARPPLIPALKEMLHLQYINADLQNQLLNLSSLFRALEEKHKETLEHLQHAEGTLLGLKRKCFDLRVSNMELLKAFHIAPPGSSQRLPAEAAATAAGFTQKPGPELLHFLSTYPAPAYPGFSNFILEPDTGLFNQSIPGQIASGNSTSHQTVSNRLCGAGGSCKGVDKSELMHVPAVGAPFQGETNASTGKLGIHRPQTPRSVLSLERVSPKQYLDHNSPGSSSCSSPTSPSDSVQYAPSGRANTDPGEARTLPPVPLQRPHLPVPRSIGIRANGAMFARRGPSSFDAVSPSGEFSSPHRTLMQPNAESLPSNREECREALNSTGLDHGASNANIVEEAVLQLWDVSDQGMYKTEICNKWFEVGWCSYGSRCQFAHGVEELRHVLRHPRYKTELCRMVAGGGKCSYAHRCHFRHVLTKEEKAKLFPEEVNG